MIYLLKILFDIRRDFFICWIMLPADLKNWDLKKKEKKRILPYTTAKLFIFGLIKNHQENNYFKT